MSDDSQVKLPPPDYHLPGPVRVYTADTVRRLIAQAVAETTRDLNSAWYAALERRFPADEIAVLGWRCRMVLYDANGEPCATRQPSHAELREAMAVPEWRTKKGR